MKHARARAKFKNIHSQAYCYVIQIYGGAIKTLLVAMAPNASHFEWSIRQKNRIDLSDILSYNLIVLQNIVFKKNHCVKPEFGEIMQERRLNGTKNNNSTNRRTIQIHKKIQKKP